jgi:hypothetical protein
MIYTTSEAHWWWRARAIARGEFPLENLPEHVLERARKLNNAQR